VCTAKVALEPVVVARPHRRPSIARLDLQIGWRGGAWQRKPGAARVLARVVHQLLVVALEQVVALAKR